MRVGDVRYYAGIGSRKTPPSIQAEMTRLAGLLSDRGFILRSGGAEGADTAFEGGADYSDIYVPWVGYYKDRPYTGVFTKLTVFTQSPYCEAALTLAKKFHPRWDACSQGAKKLLARNGMQILGESLNNPSEFVICWTPDGKHSGGTGQALRLADHYKIPIFNLHSSEDRAKLEQLIATFPILDEEEKESLLQVWGEATALR